MCQKVVIYNEKGGVGKTTLTCTLGVGLAALGYRVVMVDMDPQGHVSHAFGMLNENGQPREGIFQLLVLERELGNILSEIDSEQYEGLVEGARPGSLTLLPGSKRTATTAVDLQIQGSGFDALGDALAPLGGQFDFMLVDTSPSVSLFTPSIICMADYVLIPTKLERLAVNGVAETIQTMTRLAKLHQAQVLGVVPMMTRNTREHDANMEYLLEVYGAAVWVSMAVPQSIIWAEATDMEQTVMRYQPGHSAAGYAWAVVAQFCKALGVSS